MISSLNDGTAQLPRIDLASYKSVIGNDTVSCIASGIINSSLGLVDNVIKNLKSESIRCTVFITGGNAEKIKKHISFEHTFVKDLVMIGIKSVSERENKL